MQGADGDIAAQAEGATIDLTAGDEIDMDIAAETTSTNGHIRYEAVTGDVTLGTITAGSGNVAVIATAGSIKDLDDAGAVDIIATDLILIAGTDIGIGTNHIETRVAILSAKTSGTNGMFVTEWDRVSINDVTVSVNRIDSDGATPASTTDQTLSDLTSSVADESRLILSAGGDITVYNTAGLYGIDARGNILLDAGGDIVLENDAAVLSRMGNVSIIAAKGVAQKDDADILAYHGTIDVEAEDGDIVMAAGTVAASYYYYGSPGESDTHNIRYQASGTIRLAGIDAGNGDVSIVAGVDITDNGDVMSEVTADELRMVAGGNIGEPHLTNRGLLELTANELAAQATGGAGIFAVNTRSLMVAEVDTVIVHRVNTAGGIADRADAGEMSDVVTLSNAGTIVLLVSTGDLTVTDGGNGDGVGISAHSTGNILLNAQETGGSVHIQSNADIRTATGHITLSAGQGITLGADADVTSNDPASAGTLDIYAGTGSFVMDETATLQTVNGDIRITAGDDVLDQVVLGDITAANANVSVATPGSVLDTADTDNEVTALGLRIAAGKGVGLLSGNSLGGAVNAVETAVAVLSILVQGSDGVNILEDDALTIGDVVSLVDNTKSVAVDTVNADATVTRHTEATQSDVVVTNVNGDNGSIVIVTEAGDLTLTEGTATDDLATDGAVMAHGSGNIFLNAAGAGTAIIAAENAAIESTTGHITLSGARDIILGTSVDVITTGAGTMDILAGSGSFAMTSSTTLQTVDGDIRITAGDDVLDQVVLGDVTASNANVSVETPGSVLDTADTDNEVTALGLRIAAGKGVGLLSGNSLGGAVNAVETAVAVLSILLQGSDGVNILEDDALTIGDVVSLVDNTKSVAVDTVNADATVTRHTEATQSDVVVTNVNGDNGAIVIVTEAGGPDFDRGHGHRRPGYRCSRHGPRQRQHLLKCRRRGHGDCCRRKRRHREHHGPYHPVRRPGYHPGHQRGRDHHGCRNHGYPCR